MSDRPIVLQAVDLQLATGTQIFSETICKQEIVGLAGLDGHGQAQFLETLAGAHQPARGRIEVLNAGSSTSIGSLNDAAKAKVGYLPSDRKRNGIFPGLAVADNFTLGNLSGFSKAGWLKRSAIHESLDNFRDKLSISYASEAMPINRLSGGNQQKVLLARAMARNPEIMLLNDPTRGVDIQTRQALYQYFRAAVSDMALTIVVLSTELEEIIELCDRVIVFRDHGISARLDRDQMNMDNLMAAMFGQLEISKL